MTTRSPPQKPAEHRADSKRKKAEKSSPESDNKTPGAQTPEAKKTKKTDRRTTLQPSALEWAKIAQAAPTRPSGAMTEEAPNSSSDEDSEPENDGATAPKTPEQGRIAPTATETPNRSFELDLIRDKPSKIYMNFKHMAQSMFDAVGKLQRTKDMQKRLNQDVRERIDEVADWCGRLSEMMEYLKPYQVDEALADAVTGPSKEEAEKARAEEIQQALDDTTTQDERVKLMEEKWPQHTFRRTQLKRKSIVTSEARTKVYVEGAVDENHPIHKGMLGQFPSLSKATGRNGTFVIKATDAFQESGGEEQTTSRKLIVCQAPEVSGTESGRAERYTKTLEEATKIAEAAGEDDGEIDVLVPERGTYMWRKALEIAFTRRNVMVTLCTMKQHGKPTTSERTQRRPPRHAEVIVNANGRSYAEIAKLLKESARPDETGVDIWSLDKMPSGDARIRVLGGTSKAEELCRAIQPRVGAASVWTRQKKVAMQVSRLEEECTEEDITKAIGEALGKQTTAKVVNMRPLRGGSLKATVIVDEDDARRLAEIPRVRIGLISTTFTRREQSPNCRRCWEPRHEGRCRGPDRSRQCFRCGAEGHKKAECKGHANPPQNAA